MTDSFISRTKKSLGHIIAYSDVVAADDPLTVFFEALMNFHNHYCKDIHTPRWCQYHPMVQIYSHNTFI